MKYSSTTIAAATLLLSSEACAAQVGRNRKMKIYSSSTHLRSVDSSVGKDDTVDPYLALPDERAQRGLQELCVSMSMSSSTGSVPTTIGSMPLTLLEMSMPVTVGSVAATVGSLPTVSVQDEVVDPYLALPDEQGQGGLQELSMPSSTGSVATTIGSVPTTTIGSMPLALLEMSMPATIGSVSTVLEMSMPATIGSVPAQSFSYPSVQVSATSSTIAPSSTDDQSVPNLPASAMSGVVENSAMTTHASVAAAAAAIVSIIAGVVALV